MPKIILYPTNHVSAPGAILIGGGATGYVSISATEYVQIENTRFDGNSISNAAGVLTIGKIQMPYWSTGSVPLSAGMTNIVYINDAQGQGAINEYWGRLDFRSYWSPPFMVDRLITNTDGNTYLAGSFWALCQSYSGAIPSNHGAYVTIGPHTANKAINAVAFGSIARGTNDGMHDLQLLVSDSATNLTEKARLTSEGDFRLNGGRFYGDGSQLTNLAAGATDNPFTNFYNAYVPSITNRVAIAVPSNSAWSGIQVSSVSYQTNDAAQGYYYFRLNGATGTNVLHAYQTMVANNTTILGASSSNDASGAYAGRIYSPHNYSNAVSTLRLDIMQIYDPYPAKPYTAVNFAKPRTGAGINQQYSEDNRGTVSLGGVVTQIEIIAVGTMFDTGTVFRARGMP